jgi:hypothetical protein
VVNAATLDWERDTIFRQNGILLRFVTGQIEGEARGSLKPISHDDGTFGFQGEQETQTVSGRFIEVVATGNSPDQAEAIAFAILGLLALSLGQNVLGVVLFSEPWSATEAGQDGEAIVPGREFPRKAGGDEIGGLDGRLANLTAQGRIERARLIALRWYERGFRTEDPLDMLLSCYIGMEALVTALAKTDAPIPAETARNNQNEAVINLIGQLGKTVVDRVTFRLRGASMREQFTHYAQSRHLSDAQTQEFVHLKGIRDSAVHGDAVTVDIGTARRAEQLLRSMLKAEFGIPGLLPWEANAAIFLVKVEFSIG